MTRRLSPAGLFLALLALAMQLSVGMAAAPGHLTHAQATHAQASGQGFREQRPELAFLASLLPGADVLCQTDAGDAPDHMPGSPGHPHGDCALCPLCVAIAQPAAIPAASPVLAPPARLAIALAAPPPQATAPPRDVKTSAQPRAPPFLT